MQPVDMHPRGAGARSPRRVAVAAVFLVVIGAVALYRASASLADAACTADPPEVAVPAHRGRLLDRDAGGWDCVLVRDGQEEVARVELGWWPDDAAALWAQLDPVSD